MRRVVSAVAGVIGCLVVLAAAWTVDAQEAADVTVTEVGWWSSRPIALAQPEQGFEVSAGPQGEAQSIAAIRLSIAASQVETLQVHLVEASGGSVGTEFGTLRVCRTADTWTAANPGVLADAPTPDCTISVNLTRTLEGAWLGDITALAPQGGSVSLMIVPVYQPPTPVGLGMIVTIGSGDFAATGSTTASTTTSSDGTATTEPSAYLDPYDGSFSGGSFGVPAYTGETDFGTTTTAPPATTVPVGDDFALTPTASKGGSPPPWIRLVGLMPLCAGFGVGVVRLRRLLAERGLISLT